MAKAPDTSALSALMGKLGDAPNAARTTAFACLLSALIGLVHSVGLRESAVVSSCS